MSPATALALCALTLSAVAEDAVPPIPPAMREISPGVFQVGKLQIDQKQHSVTFPGKLNMAEGALEYLLVTPEGSTHESLLVTEIQPADLHFAMLLLGAKGSGPAAPAPAGAPPGQINNEYLKHAPKLVGDTIAIRVKWKAGEAEKTVAVEDWLMDPDTKKAASRGPWLYTGSMFNDGKFLAQQEGTFAALVTYPAALINNPRKGNDNDLVWAVNEKAVPKVDTPVEITIQLEAPPKPRP